MSLVSGLKAKEVWLPRVGSIYNPTFKEITLVNTHQFKGVTYWWVEALSKSGFTTLESFTASTIKTNFDLKPSFYQVGKTYKFRNVGRDDTWLVLDVYQVSTPAYGDKVKAVAKMTTANGLQDIQTLTQGDFARMVQA